MKWITIVLGVALFVAPFVLGYSGTPWALWISLIMGAVVTILGFTRSYKVAAILGLATFLSPWVFGFGWVPGALWSCLLLGGAIAILDGYFGFFQKQNATADQAKPHTV